MKAGKCIQIYKYSGEKSPLKVLPKVCFVIMVISVVLQIYTTNRMATKGKELLVLAQRRDTLEREIEKLELVNSSLASLSHIEKRAREMGFVAILDPINAIGPIPVAAVVNR